MSVQVRTAIDQDAETVLTLLRQLAAFEGEPDGVRMDIETLQRDAFGPAPRIEILLAERAGTTLGMLILFHAYSSWRGAKTLMIHDLFVTETARGTGAGRTLVTAAAKLAVARDCCRLDVNVLDWNEPARKFYEGLGFAALPNWVPHRLGAEAMRALAHQTRADQAG